MSIDLKVLVGNVVDDGFELLMVGLAKVFLGVGESKFVFANVFGER